MQLIGRVLILAVCVLSAYSFPNFNIEDEKSFFESLKHKFEDMAHNHFGSSNQTDNNSTYPNNNNTNNNNTNNNNNNTINNNNNTNNNNNNTILLNSCLLSFDLQEQAISNETAARIERCYQPNNQSWVFFNQTSNNTSNNSSDIKEVNAVSRQLQQDLKQCIRKNCNSEVFKCNVESLNRNLKDLAELTRKSQQGLVATGGNQTLLVEQQSACVGGAITDSKIKAIQNFNALSWCLTNIGGNNGTAVNGTHVY